MKSVVCLCLSVAVAGHRFSDRFAGAVVECCSLPRTDVAIQLFRHDRVITYAGQRLETHADLAVMEVVNPCGHRVRVVRKGLHVIEKFRVALAIECAGLIRDVGSRLALAQSTAVYHQDLLITVLRDGPYADNRRDGPWLGTDGFRR